MEVTAENLQVLAGYLQQTLSSDPSIRRPAEKLLESIEVQKNYAVLLLNLIDKADADMTIRVAGAISFKNFIKRNWIAEDEKIHEDDRVLVKSLIVALMLKSPIAIQNQLSDAVSIIGKSDFPKKWPNLIDEMVEKFATGDFNMINGVLQTAHSIFKHYRYSFKSQELWEEIKLVLDRMAQPLTNLLLATMEMTNVHKNNVEALKVIYGSLVLVCKVFYSLNSQDLPEFFEDNMETWMPAFHTLLTVDVPCLQTAEDENAGVLEHLRSQICCNIGLYVKKYDEEFRKYTEIFVPAVWELLVKTSLHTKFDALVSNALSFLTAVAERKQYGDLFERPEVLANICEKVIIPNLDFRQSDEELFEDSPEEYIRRDIEGSDIDTRRRSACDLVKILSQNYEQKIFSIFGQYMNLLLDKYKENPTTNWRSKDTAIYLVIALASRGSTQKHGITQVSELVPLPQFCGQHIVPELESQNVNELPVLKSSAIKFIMAFRSILGAQILVACIPHMIRHLQAESVVVHSYAACAIEKMMTLRGLNNVATIERQHFLTYSNEFLVALFNTLTLPNSGENEYVMKAIMRTYSLLQEVTMSYMAIALPRLTEILAQVSKNPSRPHFNHYLFETLSLTVKIVCKAEKNAVSSFEEVLFPVFQGILQQDILEFMPYVFQLLSLLLEIREDLGVIPEPYWQLFPCLLSPTLWDRPGNVKPLIRLLNAFIKQGPSQISTDKLNGLLGIYQKMIVSKSNDQEGFYLMQTLISHYPYKELEPNMQRVFNLMFHRLSSSKTTKLVRGVIVFFSFFSAKQGATTLVQLIDTIQTSMFGMVIERLFIPEMAKVNTDMDRKIVAVGVTKILTECPAMMQPPYVQNWSRLLQSVIEIFELPPDQTTIDGDHFIEVDDEPGYQAAFSQLSYAQPKQEVFLAEIQDARLYLAQSVGKLAQAHRGEIAALIATMGDRHQEALKKYCDQAGVAIA
ncbi:exportin-2 [Teleopsis dalmanni]|uniref:exportin-2 n=1 Tax=Teleopsis dalmanni TaxID=139649 RepID=UPI0018CD84EE|nr:exportin-2 [Teleopsis dalmanni]